MMMTTDHVEKYGKLCDFFWRLEHPEDGLLHTSDRCRQLASEVFELLEIEPE